MGARGEREIEAVREDGSSEVVARVLYTNRTLADIEQSTGRTIVGTLQTIGKGEIGVHDVATMLRFGMDAYRKDSRSTGRVVSQEDALEVMDKAGFPAVAARVVEAISAVLSFGTTPKN